jgi:hypothetical protein
MCTSLDRYQAIHLDFAMVCEQIRLKLDQYGINSLVADQYCFAMLKQHFSRLNIFYREFPFGTGTRASLFGNLPQLIIQQKVAIIDDPELLRQLRSLEEVRTANGNIDIRPARSAKDDLAIAVALAASELSEAVLGQCVPVIRDPSGHQSGNYAKVRHLRLPSGPGVREISRLLGER